MNTPIHTRFLLKPTAQDDRRCTELCGGSLWLVMQTVGLDVLKLLQVATTSWDIVIPDTRQAGTHSTLELTVGGESQTFLVTVNDDHLAFVAEEPHIRPFSVPLPLIRTTDWTKRVSAFEKTSDGKLMLLRDGLGRLISDRLYELRIATTKDLGPCEHHENWESAKRWLARKSGLRLRTVNRVLRSKPCKLKHYAAAFAALEITPILTTQKTS